jgi:DNA-binding transcriptional LysR family regulator
MFDWQDLRYFLAVAEAGTLSGAARRLKVDHVTVSRRITALEAALGVRLIDRLPRECRPTSVGARVLDEVIKMNASADAVARTAKAANIPLTGRVSVSAPPVLVAQLLAGAAARFRREYPEILISLAAQGEQVSLSRREADVAIRLVRPAEARSVIRKIGRMEFGLYAGSSYSKLGQPDAWEFIAFDQRYAEMPQQRWLLAIAGQREVACELNHISEHLVAARSGAGIAGLPCFIGEPDPDLVRVDLQAAPFGRDIWLTVHRDLQQSPAVRAVMDFAAGTIADNHYLCLRTA